MEPGDSIKLALPNTSSARWSSSNTSVVRVNDRGKVTAINEGSAVVTASSGTATVKVKVNVED